MRAAREEATEKETLVPADVKEHTTYTQNFDNELYDPEEVQSFFFFTNHHEHKRSFEECCRCFTYNID